MPVLQNSLNFDYSPCLSNWTAVRSSSEEINVTLTAYIRLWLVPSYCGEIPDYLSIHVDENLVPVIGIYLEICGSFFRDLISCGN